MLGSSLDLEASLNGLARMAVPDIADWCAVDLIGAEGQLERVAIFHADPSKIELALRLHRLHPPRPSDTRGAFQVLRTCQSELHTEITSEMLEPPAPDPELQALIASLGLRSSMRVPLIALRTGLVFWLISSDMRVW